VAAGCHGGLGSDGLNFAREAHAAGVKRAVICGSFPPPEMEAIRSLGFLTSEYDNYSDIREGPLGKTTDNVEEAALRDQQGNMVRGWLAKDGRQYYIRASSRAEDAARALIPSTLKKYPFTARFLDVHSTINFWEDYHPQRRATHSDDMRYRQKLYGYVNELGLVTGGEHGKAWCLPYLDYIEGTMSGSYWWQMDGGDLVRVKDRQGLHPNYLRYGINPAARVPLWELANRHPRAAP
jgi:hypothetical protein